MTAPDLILVHTSPPPCGYNRNLKPKMPRQNPGTSHQAAFHKSSQGQDRPHHSSSGSGPNGELSLALFILTPDPDSMNKSSLLCLQTVLDPPAPPSTHTTWPCPSQPLRSSKGATSPQVILTPAVCPRCEPDQTVLCSGLHRTPSYSRVKPDVLTPAPSAITTPRAPPAASTTPTCATCLGHHTPSHTVLLLFHERGQTPYLN